MKIEFSESIFNHCREDKWLGKVCNTTFYFILLTLLQKNPLLTYGAKLVVNDFRYAFFRLLHGHPFTRCFPSESFFSNFRVVNDFRYAFFRLLHGHPFTRCFPTIRRFCWQCIVLISVSVPQWIYE